jgi:hypothetical protein
MLDRARLKPGLRGYNCATGLVCALVPVVISYNV